MIKDGIYYGVGFGLAALAIGLAFSPWWAAPLALLAAFCLWFFRDPEREIPDGPVAVSAADGVVTHVRELGDGRQRVSVFLNIFDVHVNRSPVAGRVTAVEYDRGGYRMAHLETASERNERNALTIQPDREGASPVVVKQIAGLVARRIVCYKKVGDTLARGERFGLIKFGSRTDVELGPEWELTIQVGDRVAGGSSVIARLRADREPPH